jgi:hypothetical protein
VSRDNGSAPVEFVLLVPFVVAVVVAVLQLALVLHVRATMTSAAAEAARYAANSDVGASGAPGKSREILQDSGIASLMTAVSARRINRSGVATIEVDLTARVPLLGLLGPTTMTVRGHSLAEES